MYGAGWGHIGVQQALDRAGNVVKGAQEHRADSIFEVFLRANPQLIGMEEGKARNDITVLDHLRLVKEILEFLLGDLEFQTFIALFQHLSPQNLINLGVGHTAFGAVFQQQLNHIEFVILQVELGVQKRECVFEIHVGIPKGIRAVFGYYTMKSPANKRNSFATGPYMWRVRPGLLQRQTARLTEATWASGQFFVVVPETVRDAVDVDGLIAEGDLQHLIRLIFFTDKLNGRTATGDGLDNDFIRLLIIRNVL